MTHSEMVALIDELAGVQPDPEGYYTMVEWTAALDAGCETMSKRFKVARAAGRLDVTKVAREAVDGSMRQVPAYRVRPT